MSGLGDLLRLDKPQPDDQDDVGFQFNKRALADGEVIQIDTPVL
jgi:hypothetical protein